MYSSHLLGSRSEQSASLPGSVRLSSALLRMTRSRALRGGVAGAGGGQALLHDRPAGARVLLQELAEGLAHDLLHLGLDFGVHQLDLGLALELRVAVLDADDGGQAFARVVAGEVGIGVLQQAVLARVVVDRARERHPQPGQVRAAVDGVDRVGEGVDRFGVGVGVLQRHLDAGAVHLALDVDDRVQHFAVAVEVAHEGGDAALEVERHLAAVALDPAIGSSPRG